MSPIPDARTFAFVLLLGGTSAYAQGVDGAPAATPGAESSATAVTAAQATPPAAPASSPTGVREAEAAPQATAPGAAAAPMASITQKPPAEAVDPGPPVLLSGKHLTLGGYGGLSVVGSSMKGKGVVYVGGEGALLVDHRLAIGLAGYGLASHISGPDDIYGDPQRLGFGYGGFLLRYHFLDKRPYYFSVGALVGAGGVTYMHDGDRSRSDNRASNDRDPDAVFVAEPSINGHLNLTRWARVGAQISYRFVSGVNNLTDIREKDLSGFAYGGNIQFGEF